MYTKIYWLHQFSNKAKLAIMARPRGGEWLEDEIIQFMKQQVGIIVSLLESDEIYELGLRDEEKLCTKHGITYINFPIRDRDIPRSKDRVHALVNKLSAGLDEGASIVIHCRMGIGRSSIIAGAVLVQKGVSVGDLCSYISKLRGVKVPDTEEQLKWISSFQRKP